MSLSKRLEKLEGPSELESVMPKIIGFTSVKVGDAGKKRKLLGYRIDGTDYMRKDGESENDFGDRIIEESGHKNDLPLIAFCIDEVIDELEE